MTIRIEALRTFLAVAEARNIKDAAARLLRTPSAVSMTLSQLEADLGGPLFEHDRKSSLTALGRFVQEVAQVMVRDHDRGLEIIEAYAQNRTGKLRLAAVPSIATHLLPVLLRGFASARPQAEIELVDTDSGQVLERVATGQADFGICGTPPADTALLFRPLFEDPFRLVCAAGNRLADMGRPIRWEDLTGQELILNEASRVIPAPQYAALANHARLTMRNMTSLLAMVQAGMGITLLPALACASLPAGLTSLALLDESSRRIVGTVTRSGTAESPLTRAFHTYLDENAPALLTSLGLSRVQPADTRLSR